MSKTYLFAVTFDDAEVADLCDSTLPSPLRAEDLVKRGLDFAQQGTVDAVVVRLGELGEQEEDNFGQVVVYTGLDSECNKIDFGWEGED